MAQLLCPHCGAPTGDFSDLNMRAFSRLERRIIEALVAGGQRHLSKAELAHQIYFDDPTGGPDWAEQSIAVRMTGLRKKLGKSGFTIETRWGVGYRLLKTADLDKAGAQ